MTGLLYRDDAYAVSAPATVLAHTAEGGIVPDATLFYPTGGGQPGDSGRLEYSGGSVTIATTIRDRDGQVVLVPSEPVALPAPGQQVTQHIDWERRYAFMRMHTALHLLSVVIPLPVTGGAVGRGKGRIDFDMPEPPADRDALEAQLNDMVARDLPVTEDWITEAALDANPGLVKTMSVQPPRGAGRIRLVRIGQGASQIDLQPCGGTHVARTSEIRRLRLGKIEKKSRLNRRVYLHIDD